MSDTLSPKIGGRVVSPNFPVVDGSPPSELDKSFDESLQAYVKENIPLESTEGIQRRERVLNRMGALSRDWIRSVCIKRGLSKDVVDAAGGQLFTSGSYRLGVHEPGADIDTILVVPNVCTKQDFFGTMPAIDDNNNDNDSEQPLRDPDSLAERIRRHPDVTNFVPIEGAAVPVLTFDWEGINIDLLFARLNTASVPPGFDIDNDAVLDGVDSGTEKSLNGPRVTNLIAALVSGTPQRYQTFLSVVRCVRKWAKARGLYSNKMVRAGKEFAVLLFDESSNTNPLSTLFCFITGILGRGKHQYCSGLLRTALSQQVTGKPVANVLSGLQNMALAETDSVDCDSRCGIWAASMGSSQPTK
jgi:poly(A) polymerase Pap1